MTTSAIAQNRRVGSKPSFMSILASEITKLKSIRATYIEIFLTLALGIGMTALICLAIGSTWDQMNAQDQADFSPADISSFGAVFAVIVMVVMGVMFVSSEYTSGMIRLTLTTTPKRTSVLVAKMLIITFVTLVLGFLVALGSFYAGQAVLGSYDGVPTVSIGDSSANRAVLGVWLLLPVYPLLGAAVAVVLRSTASAITAILGLIFVPSIFGALLPDVLQKNVLRYLPNFAIDSLSATGSSDSITHLDTLPAIIVLAVWVIGFFAVAFISLNRRDV
jgi:ABC-type transport system involved in multi-copper enzyme maturation permease subunit